MSNSALRLNWKSCNGLAEYLTAGASVADVFRILVNVGPLHFCSQLAFRLLIPWVKDMENLLVLSVWLSFCHNCHIARAKLSSKVGNFGSLLLYCCANALLALLIHMLTLRASSWGWWDDVASGMFLVIPCSLSRAYVFPLLRHNSFGILCRTNGDLAPNLLPIFFKRRENSFVILTLHCNNSSPNTCKS